VFFPSLRQTIDDQSANTAPPEAGRDPFETGRVEPGPIDPGHLERLLLAARSPSPGEGAAPEFRSVVARSDAQRRELSAALAAQGLDQVSCGWLGSSGAVIVLLQPAERQGRGFSGSLVRAASRIARSADICGLTAFFVLPAEGGLPLPRSWTGTQEGRGELLIAIGSALPRDAAGTGEGTRGRSRDRAGAGPDSHAPGEGPGGTSPGLLMSFLDIAEAAAAAEDIDRLLETTARVLGRLFPVDGASLALREDGGIAVRAIRPDGNPGERAPEIAEPRWLPDDPSHLFGWVMARDRPLWRNDISAELRFAESVPGDGMLSDMVIPLRARGRMIGAFRVSGRTRHAFEPEDFDILERCADLTAVAVENQRLLQRTRRLSEIDGLTGVTNHRHFVELLRQEVDRSSRGGRPLSLVMADIDDFKSINDTHGHPAGDAVLRHVAQVLAGLLRRTDVVARYGGEEFVAMLPEAGPEPAASIAETMRAEVERRSCSSTALERPLAVRISLGVASLPDDAGSVAELIAAADRGLYQAKREGKNRVRRA